MHSIIYIMGVSGVGKTTIGQGLSKSMSLPFFDADDFHSTENIKKMSSGVSLTDHDRDSWLTAINQFVVNELRHTSLIMACSALKESYRMKLMNSIAEQAYWVYLKGDYKEVFSRLENRSGHFMSNTLLQSQFDILEVPSYGCSIPISNDPLSIIMEIELYMKNIKL